MSTEQEKLKFNNILTNITQEYIPHIRDKTLTA